MSTQADRLEEPIVFQQGEDIVLLQKEKTGDPKKNRERLLSICGQVEIEIGKRGRKEWK